MGNKDSKHDHAADSSHHHHHHHHHNDAPAPNRNGQFEDALKLWQERRGGITRSSLQEVFGENLGAYLWTYFGGQANNVDSATFESKVAALFGSSFDVYYQLLCPKNNDLNSEDVAAFIHLCRTSAGVEFVESTDEKFLDTIVSSMMSGRSKIQLNLLRDWVQQICPRLLVPVQRVVTTGIKTANSCTDQWIGPPSSTLSQFKLWFVHCSVPYNYIGSNSSANFDTGRLSTVSSWHLLYASGNDGLSPNRFETKVFNYRGPTVMVAELQDGSLYCVCIDEEWKYSTQRWGNTGCAIYRLQPRVELLETGGNLLYYNTKQRGFPTGLQIGSDAKNPHFNLSSDFTEAVFIEVWGCGSTGALEAQENYRQWEKRLIEKRQKVPLPGRWDEDNPDQSLLEMAGVKMHHAER